MSSHHILIFLTGQEEIEALTKNARTIAKVNQSIHWQTNFYFEMFKSLFIGFDVFFFFKDLQGKYPNLKVCPLFANLPQVQQMDAFNQPPAGTRKVVLSTNIAETSVTIDGIRYVIDCGRVKARCAAI